MVLNEGRNYLSNKSREIVRLGPDKKLRIGYSIGTVYFALRPFGLITLYNCGYCPKTKEFYFNENVHLPNEIFEKFNNKCLDDNIIAEMAAMDIYDYEDIKKMIRQYEAIKFQYVVETERCLNLTRTLNLSKKGQKTK